MVKIQHHTASALIEMPSDTYVGTGMSEGDGTLLPDTSRDIQNRLGRDKFGQSGNRILHCRAKR